MGFLDLVFPKRCVSCKKLGSYICTNCFSYLSFDTKSICLVCQRGSIDGLTHPGCRGKYTIDGCFSAISYRKTAKKLIYNFKYNPYLLDLRKFLSDLLYESIVQNESFQKVLQSSKDWTLVSIPLHASKLRSRGYNQSEILAEELAKRLMLPRANLLKRVKKSQSQVGLKLEQRKKNIKGAFAPSYEFKVMSSKLRGMNILLIDDIVTTGSTLLESANVLKRNGARKVYGITLARD